MEKLYGTVKQYPYRTARVQDVIASFPRSEMRDFERMLVAAADTNADNHVVYEVEQFECDSPLYIMISDFTVTFARTLHEGRW